MITNSSGLDKINKCVKYVKHMLVAPLTLINNQTLSSGSFPVHLKIAKIKPLFG